MSTVYKQITVRVPVEHIVRIDEIVDANLEDSREVFVQNAIGQMLDVTQPDTLPEVVRKLISHMYINGVRFSPHTRDDVLGMFNEVIER